MLKSLKAQSRLFLRLSGQSGWRAQRPQKLHMEHMDFTIYVFPSNPILTLDFSIIHLVDWKENDWWLLFWLYSHVWMPNIYTLRNKWLVPVIYRSGKRSNKLILHFLFSPIKLEIKKWASKYISEMTFFYWNHWFQKVSRFILYYTKKLCHLQDMQLRYSTVIGKDNIICVETCYRSKQTII